MKPETLVNLTEKLHSLPGITRKQAERLAFFIVSGHDEEARDVVDAIDHALDTIRNCEICGHLTEDKVCSICADKKRTKTLVIVETPLDVFKFEESGTINPYYHVLGGLINVSTNIDFNDLNIKTLKKRAQGFNEIIIALSPNLEGIVTANFIKNMLTGKKVTQLAQGIPLGAAMEYVDGLTLRAALENRKEVK